MARTWFLCSQVQKVLRTLMWRLLGSLLRIQPRASELQPSRTRPESELSDEEMELRNAQSQLLGASGGGHVDPFVSHTAHVMDILSIP